MANQTLNLLNIKNFQITPAEVDLRDKGRVSYANPEPEAQALLDLFRESENIHLDTTYTTKVISSMVHILKDPSLTHKNILYWHTFSPAAMNSDREYSMLRKENLFVNSKEKIASLSLNL